MTLPFGSLSQAAAPRREWTHRCELPSAGGRASPPTPKKKRLTSFSSVQVVSRLVHSLQHDEECAAVGAAEQLLRAFDAQPVARQLFAQAGGGAAAVQCVQRWTSPGAQAVACRLLVHGKAFDAEPELRTPELARLLLNLLSSAAATPQLTGAAMEVMLNIICAVDRTSPEWCVAG